MKLIVLSILILALGHLSGADNDVDIWTVTKTKGKEVTFVAEMNVQLHLTNKAMNQVVNITGSGTLKASFDNSSEIQFSSENNPNQVVQFTFLKDNTNYMLSNLSVNVTIDNKAFPGALNLNESVILTMPKTKNVFKSALTKSYTCSMRTLIELNSSSKNVSMAVMEFQVVKLEAFVNKFSPNEDPCFYDKIPQPAVGKWDVKDSNNKTCLRMDSMVTFQLQYKDILNETMVTNVSIASDAVSKASCNETVANVTFALEADESVMAEFLFITTPAAKQYDTTDTYEIDTISLTLNTDSRYVPNHPINSNKIVETKSGLKLFSTPVGSSYECDVVLNKNVTSNVSVSFNATKIQAFKIPDKNFGPAFECTEMKTTPMPPTTPHPDPVQPETYSWEAIDSEKTLCFRAMAGIQLRVSYINVHDGKSTLDTRFDMSNTSMQTSTNCSMDSFDFVIEDKGREQNLTLTFNRTKTTFFLASVKYDFMFSNKTFTMAPVTATAIKTESTNLMLMESSLGSSYKCSMESQVSLATTNTNVSNIFLRITDISMFQPYVPSDNSSKEQKCFHDTVKDMTSQGTWSVKDPKTNLTCARFQSAIQLSISYFDIAGKLKAADIYVDGKNVSMLPGSSCTSNVTKLNLDLDGTQLLNLTLTFVMSSPSSNLDANSATYALDGVTLTYRTDIWYLQNHADYGKTITVSQSGLVFGKTPVSSSFRCDLEQSLSVNSTTTTDLLTVMLKDTQWEAFGMNKSGDFNQAKFCAAEITTPMPVTTPMVTTNKPYQPVDLSIHNYTVLDSKDKKTVCLLAQIGVQVRTTYDTKNATRVEIGFNFNSNNSMVSGTCSGNTSIITFNNTKQQQMVSLTFKRDVKTNQTYLSAIDVEYTITSSMFPNAKDVNEVYKFSQTALAEINTPLNHSYLCNTVETDVLVNVSSNVILRITGVKLQAFDVMNRTYSKSQKCFSDQELPTANVGNWTVKSNNSVCSMYMFSATANITYMTLLGKTATARIPLDNSTKTKVDGDCHFGSDGISFFWVKMEEVTFNFFFNRTNTGSKFNYYLFNVHISYNTNSKYFPNHAYLDDGNDVVSNSSLRLFESDQDHSYKCSAQTTIMLNKTAGHVTFKDVQVQPFGIEKNNGVFSAADDCNVDDLSPIVPIIVGAVLAGLIVIVVVAYFIGRKRSRKPEYETI